MAYQTKEKLETQNPTSLKQICDTIGEVTPRHIQKVADLIGTDWQNLGVKLNIPYDELEILATPLTGGPTQYAARMFNTWHRQNGHLSIAEVQKEVVAALEEAKRKDVADEVRNKPLHTVNDMQRVFQEISHKLVKHWKEVGLCLNLDGNTLDTCKASAGPEEDPRKKMLQMWQQRTQPAEQTTQLITALEELKLLDIIKAIGGTQAKQLPKDPTARPDDRGEDIVDARERSSEEIQTSDFGYCPENTAVEQGAPVQQPRQQPKQQRQSQPPSTTRSRPSNSGGPKAKQAKSEDDVSHDDNRVVGGKTLKENQLRAIHQIKTARTERSLINDQEPSPPLPPPPPPQQRQYGQQQQQQQLLKQQQQPQKHDHPHQQSQPQQHQTQQQQLTIDNTYHTSSRDFGYRPENTAVEQTPAVAASAELSTSTFHKAMRKRLKKMNDALVNSGSPPRVLVAVLDTGMYSTHPRLHPHIKWCKTMIDGEEEDLNFDRLNHGTISAGVIVDFAGVCADMINIKVMNETSSLETLHAGFKYINEWENLFNQKVSIIVTSICASKIEQGLQDQFDNTLYNLAKDKVIICSAANKGATRNDTVCYPATESSVLAIGSLDPSGNRSGFSSQGHALDFMFQGEGFISTSRPPLEGKDSYPYPMNPYSHLPNDWFINSASGTSFAAPQCAAAIAVIMSYTELTLGIGYRQKLTRTDAMRKLIVSVCEQKHDNETGYGFPRLDKLNHTYIRDQVDKMYSA